MVLDLNADFRYSFKDDTNPAKKRMRYEKWDVTDAYSEHKKENHYALIMENVNL